MSNRNHQSHLTNAPIASQSADVPSLAEHSIGTPAPDLAGQHIHAVLSTFLTEVTKKVQGDIHRANYRRVEGGVRKYEESHKDIVNFVKQLWTLVDPLPVVREEHVRIIQSALREVQAGRVYGGREIRVTTTLALAAFINSLPSEVAELPSRLPGEELYPAKT